jgi:hypothetical protein
MEVERGAVSGHSLFIFSFIGLLRFKTTVWCNKLLESRDVNFMSIFEVTIVDIELLYLFSTCSILPARS